MTDEWARAGIGGTGAAKCGGNYAASLIAQYEGYDHGCTQVMFIEASGKDRVEELGGTNVFYVTADGELVTPELTGTILDGITRDSIRRSAPTSASPPVQMVPVGRRGVGGIASGRFVEAFCCAPRLSSAPSQASRARRGSGPADQSFDAPSRSARCSTSSTVEQKTVTVDAQRVV